MLFSTERFLLLARGTLFYRTRPEIFRWAYRESRAPHCLSKNFYTKSQKKKESRVQTDAQFLWSSRCVSEFRVNEWCVWIFSCSCSCYHTWAFLSSLVALVSRKISHKCPANNVFHYSCFRCCSRLHPGGEGAGGVGAGGPESGPFAALSQ